MYHKELFQTSVICLLTVKWSNSSISKNPISIIHLFGLSLNYKDFYLASR